MAQTSSKKSIGLTLSGGGAKGIAHIGVVRALLENGIFPEIVSGTSAGSIIGSLYAAGCSPDDMERFVTDASLAKIFRVVGIPGAGLVKLDYLKERMSEFIPQDDFSALKIPMFVCATNLNIGKPEIFSSGTLFDKVMASCAVPWLFKPVEIDGQMYADGGIMNNLPVNAIRDNCEFLIASNVKPKLFVQSNKELDTFMGITQRLVDLSLWSNSKPNVKACDIYIAPAKVQGFSFFSVRRVKELCQVGYEEAMLQMPRILQRLKHAETPNEIATDNEPIPIVGG
jgi:NTE family protein